MPPQPHRPQTRARGLPWRPKANLGAIGGLVQPCEAFDGRLMGRAGGGPSTALRGLSTRAVRLDGKWCKSLPARVRGLERLSYSVAD